VRAPAKRLLRAKSGSRVRIPLPPPEGYNAGSKIAILLPGVAYRKLEIVPVECNRGRGAKESRNPTILRMSPFTVGLEAYKLLALVQQLPRPFHGFGFGIDADKRLCAGKADEQPGLVAKEEAKPIDRIRLGHS
jgi:hypothetical protein